MRSQLPHNREAEAARVKPNLNHDSVIKAALDLNHVHQLLSLSYLYGT
jgi:hypothetical protein